MNNNIIAVELPNISAIIDTAGVPVEHLMFEYGKPVFADGCIIIPG